MKAGNVLVALVAGTLLLSAGAILLRAQGERTEAVARIYQDGALVREIRLDQVNVPFSFEIPSGSGGSNTVAVEHGRIRVIQASCPDQICVDQGWISDGTVPIVCLPNKLMVEIVGGGEAFDAAAG